MSLNSKTKFVNIVVRKKNYDIKSKLEDIKKWCNENCVLYVGIIHEHDVNLQGEIEDPHLHLILTLKTRKLLSTTLNSFCSYLTTGSYGVMIDKVNSYEGSIQYLLHKNDPKKTQHSFEELFYNYDKAELETIIDCEGDSLNVDKLYNIVVSAHSNYDIIRALGLGRYNLYRKVIMDLKDDIRRKQYYDKQGYLLQEEKKQEKLY